MTDNIHGDINHCLYQDFDIAQVRMVSPDQRVQTGTKLTAA